MEATQRRQTISRRTFLRMSAGIAGIAAVAACAPVPASSPQPGGSDAPAAATVEIDVWTGWTEDAATNIEKILAGYNESQDRVVAKHVVVPEAMTQKLLAAISAGSPPAGAIVFGASIAYQLAAQDALLALDEIGNPDQVADLKDWMEPAIWDLGVYEGNFVYASMWNQCMGIFVNTDIAEQQGVDPDSPPATLEELDAIWDQLTIWDSNGNIDVLGGDFTWTAMIMGRFLGQFVDEDGITITANHPNNVRALEWLGNRWQRIGPQNLQDFYASLQGRGERSAGQDPFLSGLRATLVTGPWQYNTMRNFKPEGFNYTVWPLPGPAGQTEKGMHTYGDGWVVPKGAPAPDATWEIISTMTGATGNRDIYTSLFTTWLCVNGPVAKEMTQWPTFQTDVMGECPGYEDIFLADLFDSDYYLYPPKLPTSNSYQSMMNAEWEKVRLGQKEAQEALDFVTVEAQKELDIWISQNSG
jgi:multiple sugar transport system substrate-binding protein